MRILYFILLLLLSSANSFCQTNEIETNADIKSVTIYNSSAEINYQKEVSLPQGKSTLIFTDLSPFIIENTINISTSNPDVDIITVTEKINYIKEKKEINKKTASIQDSVDKIENELGFLQCKIDALNAEKNILFKDILNVTDIFVGRRPIFDGFLSPTQENHIL